VTIKKIILFFRCLHYFGSSVKLDIYVIDYGKLNDCALRLPSENDMGLNFSNHCRKERMPFVVYADLECRENGERPEYVNI